MNSGWISIHRKLADNPLWLSEPFTRAQAWVDMILLTNHKNGYIYQRGIKIEIKRGELGWSQVSLGKRWKWSRGKVKRFLNDLETEQQIVQQNSNVSCLISITNYNEYQGNSTANSTANGQQTVQQTDSKQYTNNNDNKENNDNNKANSKTTKNITERKKEFIDEVKEEWIKKGGESFMTEQGLIEFTNYWIESGSKDKKFRREKQTSFSIGGRLSTWLKNDYNNVASPKTQEDIERERKLRMT